MEFAAGKQTKESHSPLLFLWQGSQMLCVTVITVLISLYANTGNCGALKAWLAVALWRKNRRKIK